MPALCRRSLIACYCLSLKRLRKPRLTGKRIRPCPPPGLTDRAPSLLPGFASPPSSAGHAEVFVAQWPRVRREPRAVPGPWADRRQGAYATPRSAGFTASARSAPPLLTSSRLFERSARSAREVSGRRGREAEHRRAPRPPGGASHSKPCRRSARGPTPEPRHAIKQSRQRMTAMRRQQPAMETHFRHGPPPRHLLAPSGDDHGAVPGNTAKHAEAIHAGITATDHR